ncbi:GntR family transcriptional regulator [Engelhardtia mirabilis]|uniref:GntR family transcriptional regulator n=1 Tax=Engelhardtia mirabilis TaxID=2528011 RepID=UPI003AF3B063
MDTEAPEPPSQQLVERCLDGIARGDLAPGDKLPSVRALAGLALVNHNTVARAYRELDLIGAVRGEGGRGVFVTEAGPQIARQRRAATTWSDFERALETALRAGHSIEDLSERVRTAESKRRPA